MARWGLCRLWDVIHESGYHNVIPTIDEPYDAPLANVVAVSMAFMMLDLDMLS